MLSNYIELESDFSKDLATHLSVFFLSNMLSKLYSWEMTKPSNIALSEQKYRPSRYMRERHPDLFSDSVACTEYEVSREILSYHLETLTNQKDETAFEHFSMRLCEKFIAPNMRPQTGPVGGGDGKTDSETYPVSSEIAQRWFVPDQHKANERKAFAFSAKKEWRPKVKMDVAAIAGTERNYDQIYFITNQFVPAKKSAEVQDELTKRHGIPVTILDRTWLLDRVFGHESMDIAVEELGIGKGLEKHSRKRGPTDIAREAELAELEKKIGDGTQYQEHSSVLAEDARRAAILSRSLELAEIEVNGRFDRAVRLAREFGNRKLELSATYDWAWTSHFWYEDHVRTSELYEEVESLAITSDDANDLELLNNLLSLIRVSVQSGCLDTSKGKLNSRTKYLKEALSNLAVEKNRPNNALHAEAILLMARVSEKGVAHRDDPLINIWVEFTDVIKRADGLGTFPFTTIAEALIQIGEFIADSKEFDILFETITNALATRSSEGEAATKNVQRAYQKLAKKLPYDAIRYFGRAVALLVKEEYEEDLLDALVGISFAFEQVGLHWAARNFALAATSSQFYRFKKSGSLSAVRPSILARYFDTELMLGRIPQVLSAHELELIVRSSQSQTEGEIRLLGHTQQLHMMQVGALLLRTKFSELEQARQLPETLNRLALPMSRAALLFLMGHEKTLREENSIPDSETGESVSLFFKDMYNYGEQLSLPCPDFCLKEKVTLTSNVLGCRIELECENNLISLGIGEALLGSLEAMLATSLDHLIFPQLDTLKILVGTYDQIGAKPVLQFEEVGGVSIGKITHKKDMKYSTKEDNFLFTSWLKDSVLDIFLRFAMPQDVEKWLNDVFQEERGLDRSLTFSNIPMMLENLHGDRTHLSVADWIDPSDKLYEVLRTEPLLFEQQDSQASKDSKREVEAPTDGVFNSNRKHSKIKLVSPIDAQKWDKAGWNGTIFFWSPPNDSDAPPVIGLAFENKKKAREIFSGWRTRFGEDDIKGDLQITIVRGIAADNPAAYAVMVGANPDNVPVTKDNVFGFISRINRMYPTSTYNLDAFLADYARHNKFVLIPAHLPNKRHPPQPMFDLPVGQHNLRIVNAWEIAPSDMAASTLTLDELPFIPHDQKDAPVLETIKMMREFRDRRISK